MFEFNGSGVKVAGWYYNVRMMYVFAKQIFWGDGFQVGSFNNKHSRPIAEPWIMLAVISHNSEDCPL